MVARIGCAAGNDVMAIGPLKVLMTEWSDDRTLNRLHLTSLGYVWPKSFDDLDLTLLLESSFHVAEIWAKCGHFTIFTQLFCYTDRLGFADEGTWDDAVAHLWSKPHTTLGDEDHEAAESSPCWRVPICTYPWLRSCGIWHDRRAPQHTVLLINKVQHWLIQFMSLSIESIIWYIFDHPPTPCRIPPWNRHEEKTQKHCWNSWNSAPCNWALSKQK